MNMLQVTFEKADCIQYILHYDNIKLVRFNPVLQQGEKNETRNLFLYRFPYLWKPSEIGG
ncbi:hypothetical protein SZ13_01770 [Vibrio parahaemolyticus]|nr:hypothetical protein SZ13_01770 [Vibrio parahaemolyticus]